MNLPEKQKKEKTGLNWQCSFCATQDELSGIRKSFRCFLCTFGIVSPRIKSEIKEKVAEPKFVFYAPIEIEDNSSKDERGLDFEESNDSREDKS